MYEREVGVIYLDLDLDFLVCFLLDFLFTGLVNLGAGRTST